MSDLNVTINSSELSKMNMSYLNVTINSSDDLTKEQYISKMTNIIVRLILVLFGTVGKSFDSCVLCLVDVECIQIQYVRKCKIFKLNGCSENNSVCKHSFCVTSFL